MTALMVVLNVLIDGSSRYRLRQQTMREMLDTAQTLQVLLCDPGVAFLSAQHSRGDRSTH